MKKATIPEEEAAKQKIAQVQKKKKIHRTEKHEKQMHIPMPATTHQQKQTPTIRPTSTSNCFETKGQMPTWQHRLRSRKYNRTGNAAASEAPLRVSLRSSALVRHHPHRGAQIVLAALPLGGPCTCLALDIARRQRSVVI